MVIISGVPIFRIFTVHIRSVFKNVYFTVYHFLSPVKNDVTFPGALDIIPLLTTEWTLV